MNYRQDNDPLEWSHRAEEARAMAEAMVDLGARKTLISIAETYEAMLKRAGEREVHPASVVTGSKTVTPA